MSIENIHAELAGLAAKPEFDNHGWRLGVADRILAEVMEMDTQREEEVTKYIRQNWAPADRLAVILMDRKTGHVQQRIKTSLEITDPKYQAHLRAANANGSCVFVSMNPLKAEAQGRTKGDIAAIRHVYLDLDGGGIEAVNRILSAPGVPKPHHILKTSKENHQLVWSTSGFSQSQAETLMRGMAAEHGADPAATDSARVLRLIGFRNHKYERPHYVRDISDNPPTTRNAAYTPADFPSYGEFRVIEMRRTAAQAVGHNGSRSEKDFAWACGQLERGVPAEKIAVQLAAQRQDKPNPKYYAEHTVSAAMSKRQHQRERYQGYAVGSGA